MEPSYDEDLNENTFFQLLQTDHGELFEKATLEGWVICVPRAGSTPRYTLAHEDFYGHVLVPSDELPESHFRTLSGRAVRVCNRLVTVEDEDIARPFSTHILFEETFYTEDLVRYKVLCVQSPLVSHLGPGLAGASPLVAVHTLRECIDLLWTECSGKDILERMDAAMGAFRSTAGFDFEPLQVQKDRAGRLYVQCLQLALEDPRLKEQAGANKRLLENVKLAVETYMHHGIYRQLIKGITACTAYEDASLNKVIRNLSDIQLRDLDVRPDLCDTVPRARQELSRVDAYSTTLGKMGCLRRMVSAISKQSGPKRTSDLGGGNIIAADDLLPMIVFLVIKTALPNWIAHLTYMKHFHFSVCASCQGDEYNFLITTLEAAIEHIKSGVLLGNSAPEAQFIYELQENRETPLSDSNDGGNESDCEETCIGDFFESIKQGNIARVEKMLKRNGYVTNQSSEKTSGLCHPLCSCDRCESVVSRSLCDTTPTVRSCDDKGFTALHVACLFGQPMIVDLLVSAGADVNARDCSGSVPLHYCAARGYQNALLLLIHAGARLCERDSDGNMPLHLASNNGHEGCVKALLYFAEHVGARLDTNIANKKGDTALHFAARWGYESIVEILLDHGASCMVQNRRQLTATDCAHSLHISKLLLSHRKANKSVPSGSTGTTQVIIRNEQLDQNVEVAAASKLGLDYVDAGKDGATNGWLGNCDQESLAAHLQSTEQIKKVEKILKAIAQGDTRLACFYLGLEGCGEGGGSTARRGGAACHPLCRCETCGADADRDEEQAVGAVDVNVCNPEGVTPLHVAAMHGRADMVRLLLECGARTDVVTRARRASPLHLACQNQQLRAARLLLQAGCSVDLADVRGNTALHYCSDARLVRLLLAFRPRLDIANADGKTPLQQAEERMSLAVVALLRPQ